MNYYERHIGDYLKDTAHLSLLEHGIYTRLLDVYYTRETAIPADQAARLIGARSKEEREAMDAVLAEFFVLVDGAFVQQRCEREIERYGDKQRKAKASADARWRGREKPESSNADAMRTHSERMPDASTGFVREKMRTHSERNADGMHSQTPDTRHQSLTHPSDASGGGLAQVASPPTPPPPPFDGLNADAINRKSVVLLSPTWELPEAWGVDAEALGWKPAEVMREAEKFRQYWVSGRGQGTRRSVKGWRQTWSSWLDKAAKEKR